MGRCPHDDGDDDDDDVGLVGRDILRCFHHDDDGDQLMMLMAVAVAVMTMVVNWL